MSSAMRAPSDTNLDLRKHIHRLLAAGNAAAALELLSPVVQARPSDSTYGYLHGVALLLAGQADQAVVALRRVLAEQETPAPALLCNLGEALRRNGHPADAVPLFEQALQLQSAYPEASFNLGCALLDLKRYPEALSTFETLATAFPHTPRYLAARADALRETGKVAAAVAQYRCALALDPALAHAHANIGPLLLQSGQIDEALQHCLKATELDPASASVLQNLGRCLVELEQLDEAMQAYADALERSPENPVIMTAIARVWQEVGEPAEAGFWFSRALSREPGHPGARCGLAALKREYGALEEGLAELLALSAEYPDDVQVFNEVAQAQWDSGDTTSALETLHRSVALRPECAATHSQIGGILASAGRMEEAVTAHKEALRVNPNCIPALTGLASGQKGKLEPELAERMKMLLSNAKLRDGARAHLHNGLMYYSDSIGDYAAASQHGTESNRLYWQFRQRRGWAYDPDEYSRHIDTLMHIFDEGFFSNVKPLGSPDENLVFIVGMPRSGTTLTEQILASHPQVLGIGERDFAARALEQFGRIRRSEPLTAMANISREDIAAVAATYREEIARLVQRSGKSDVRYVVDKMPDNYSLVGWIRTLFPHARIIHARRDLRAVALSCWMTQFKQIRWACDMEHIARRIMDYQRLMRHWQKVLPGQMIETDYEGLVADQGTRTRALLDGLELPWDNACLQFYKADSVVRTASVSQVRQPIYRNSLDRWKAYEGVLKPLLDVLPANYP